MDFNYLRTELEHDEGIDHVINTIKDYADRISSPGKRAGLKNRIVLVASHYNGVFKTNPLGYTEESKQKTKRQVVLELSTIIDDLEENFKEDESIKTRVRYRGTIFTRADIKVIGLYIWNYLSRKPTSTRTVGNPAYSTPPPPPPTPPAHPPPPPPPTIS